MFRRCLTYPFFQSFSSKILLLGIVAAMIPLVSILLIFALFSQGLVHDLHQSLTDIKGREGQRLESYQHQIIHQQVRQKALDVAQDITSYLKSHPNKTWKELYLDPVFRETAVQPVGTVGETFLVAASGKKILMNNDPSHEGQTLEDALGLEEKVGVPVNLFLTGTPDLQEFSLMPGQSLDTFCHGFLVPIVVKPHQGPELLVGAWVDPEEMGLIMAQSRAIFKTALNVARALIDTRLGQFRQRLFYILAILGLLAFMASMILARRVTTQVTALTGAAEAFDQGNLAYRISNPAKDELGQLARTLNRMAASLNDNTISRLEWENTFNVLPDPVILVDTEARLTRLNRAAALYLDVFPEEARGCYVSELKPPGKDWFPYQALVQALEQGKKRGWKVLPITAQLFW